MDDKTQALAEFDRQHGIPPGVSLVAVEIGFWNMVNLILKVYVATLVASAIIGALLGVAFLVYMLLSGA